MSLLAEAARIRMSNWLGLGPLWKERKRYACMVYDEADFILASADELGDVAMDLSTIPRCSEREYADPKCPILKPDPSKPIRWVRGYSLTDMEERWVPAIMTHLYIKPGPGEYFWNQISTGTAAHTSLSSALISAICENIERDAIALTWLAQLSLPRIRTRKTVAYWTIEKPKTIRKKRYPAVCIRRYNGCWHPYSLYASTCR